mgnify:CR=1 FL=1
MGYETKLIIGYDTDLRDDDKLNYFGQFASINLGKMSNDTQCIYDYNIANQEIAKRYPKKCSYFYEGETRVVSDKYGVPLKCIDANIVLQTLKKDDESQHNTIRWAISLLESIVADVDNIQVIFFNY